MAHPRLLIDMGNLCYATLYIEQKQIAEQEDAAGSFYRHLILTLLLGIKDSFKVRSADMILCFDHKINWRKQFFPHYKAHRKKIRDDSGIDFPRFFEIIESFYHELRRIFPFPVLRSKFAEADDIIAILAQRNPNDEFIIISRDKDFQQLQQFDNVVYQWDPVKKEKIVCQRPKTELKVKICNGDPGDGVPNILSDDDTFIVPDKRQKPLGEKKAWKLITDRALEAFIKEKGILKNWNRNVRLIDLTKIPDDVKKIVTQKYVKLIINNNAEEVGMYMKRFGLVSLRKRVHEFFD